MDLLINTAYFPSIAYMSACNQAKKIHIEAEETYLKQTDRNHCIILGPNGKQTLTIPVTKPHGNHTKTKDIRISSHIPWQKIHWRSITTAYNKSPFFLYYQDHFSSFFNQNYTFLLDYNCKLLETLFQILSLNRPVALTESFVKCSGKLIDLRNKLVAKHENSSNPGYVQVFSEKHGFQQNLSILDLLCNLGPEASGYLTSIRVISEDPL